MKIVEIDTEYADILSEEMLSSDFEWFYNQCTVYIDKTNYVGLMPDSISLDTFQFTHGLINNNVDTNSKYTHYVKEIINEVKSLIGPIKSVQRVKCNMILKDTNYPIGYYNAAHTDDDEGNCITLLYYVNDSDGDTIFFNEFGPRLEETKKLTIKERITPKKGTGILFKSNQFHSSSTPIHTDRRVVINFVFEMENEIDNNLFL